MMSLEYRIKKIVHARMVELLSSITSKLKNAKARDFYKK